MNVTSLWTFHITNHLKMVECVLSRKQKIPRYDPTNVGYDSEYDLRAPPKYVSRTCWGKSRVFSFKESFLRRRQQRQEQLFYGNIMTDPRIWRGNTYTLYRNQKQEQKKVCFKRNIVGVAHLIFCPNIVFQGFNWCRDFRLKWVSAARNPRAWYVCKSMAHF